MKEAVASSAQLAEMQILDLHLCVDLLREKKVPGDMQRNTEELQKTHTHTSSGFFTTWRQGCIYLERSLVDGRKKALLLWLPGNALRRFCLPPYVLSASPELPFTPPLAGLISPASHFTCHSLCVAAIFLPAPCLNNRNVTECEKKSLVFVTLVSQRKLSTQVVREG